MAHRLLKALSRPSSYSVKPTPFWDEVTDQIAGAMLPVQLDEIEDWLRLNSLKVPAAWEEPFAELIEKKRDELASENIGFIVRDHYDF